MEFKKPISLTSRKKSSYYEPILLVSILGKIGSSRSGTIILNVKAKEMLKNSQKLSFSLSNNTAILVDSTGRDIPGYKISTVNKNNIYSIYNLDLVTDLANVFNIKHNTKTRFRLKLNDISSYEGMTTFELSLIPGSITQAEQ